jgi:hypothetical protein
MVDTGPKWATAARYTSHLVTDGMVVRIDEMRLFMAVAGHMELHQAIARHAVEEIVSRETVIESAHIDVVDVEQEPAIGRGSPPR